MSGFPTARAQVPPEDLSLARSAATHVSEPSPASSVSERTSTSIAEQDLGATWDAADDLELDSLGAEDDDAPMSAAERRAEQRRMKRFRYALLAVPVYARLTSPWFSLTHSQTRFLMSEFARQAHPDAAHRERLAREIPGLSSRQVQVWFQNRYFGLFVLFVLKIPRTDYSSSKESETEAFAER